MASDSGRAAHRPRGISIFAAAVGLAVVGSIAWLATHGEEGTAEAGADVGFHPVQKFAPYPSIREPKVVPAAHAAAVRDDESIIGVVVGEEARAYPVEMLNHISVEILNDTMGGRPVAVTWCGMCQSAVLFDRRVAGQELTFHVAGSIWDGNLVMIDDQTGSQWSQVLGRAMAGPLQGQELEVLPSVLTDWKSWRAAYPHTAVLDMAHVNEEVPPHVVRFAPVADDQFALALADDRGAWAWGFPALRRALAIEDDLAGDPVVAAFDAPAATARLFRRTVDGRVLSFHATGGRLRDEETGSTWDVASGQALDGPLAGRRLEPLPAAVIYLDYWMRFFPATQVRANAAPTSG